MDHSPAPTLPDLPPEILLGIAGHLHLTALCALRRTCKSVNNALSPLRRTIFHRVGVMATGAGIISLLDMADNAPVAKLIDTIELNCAVVLDTEDERRPALHAQLGLLELDKLDVGVIRVMGTPEREHPDQPVDPDKPLAQLLAQVFAHLPNLRTVSADYWDPEHPEDTRTPPPGTMLGYSSLFDQCVQLVWPGQASVTCLFWALLFGLARAHETRKEKGYATPMGIRATHVGVRRASFVKAMASYSDVLAPFLGNIDLLCLRVGGDKETPNDVELAALSAFLRMTPRLTQLSLYGREGQLVDAGVLASLIGPTTAPRFDRLERLELIAHDTTTSVLFDILTTTRAAWVRLADIRLRQAAGEKHGREPAWVSLLKAVSAHHQALGTTRTVTSLELSGAMETGGYDYLSIEFKRPAPLDSIGCCFVLGFHDVDNYGNVHRLKPGNDIFARVADELYLEKVE